MDPWIWIDGQKDAPLSIPVIHVLHQIHQIHQIPILYRTSLLLNLIPTNPHLRFTLYTNRKQYIETCQLLSPIWVKCLQNLLYRSTYNKYSSWYSTHRFHPPIPIEAHTNQTQRLPSSSTISLHIFESFVILNAMDVPQRTLPEWKAYLGHSRQPRKLALQHPVGRNSRTPLNSYRLQ